MSFEVIAISGKLTSGTVVTTKICPSCKIAKTVDQFHSGTSRCKECRALYYKKNRERIAIAQKEYRDKNLVKIRTASKVHTRHWREKNPDHGREYTARYKKEHPEAAERTRSNERIRYAKNPGPKQMAASKWYMANREKARAARKRWLKQNPLKHREANARRRALKRNATVGAVDFNFICQRDQMICHLCHRHVEWDDLHFDHVIPLFRGGLHSNDNLAVSHGPCNLRKGTKILIDGKLNA